MSARRSAIAAFLVVAMTGCAPATAATHSRWYIGAFAVALVAALAFAAVSRWKS